MKKIILFLSLFATIYAQDLPDLDLFAGKEELNKSIIFRLIKQFEVGLQEDYTTIFNDFVRKNNTFSSTNNSEFFRKKDRISNIADDIIEFKIQYSDSINTEGNNIQIKTLLKFYTKDSVITSLFNFNFVADNSSWRMVLDEPLQSLISIFSQRKNKSSSRSIKQITSFIENSSTLLPAKFLSSPSITELNKRIMNQYFDNNDFFSSSSEIDANLYIYGNTYNKTVLFFVDPVWGRILFINREIYEIKSYGDKNNDFKFRNPIAIAVGENGDLFVADTGLRKIIKLKYNLYSNSISYVSNLNIEGLATPSDIEFCKSFSGLPNRLLIIDSEKETLFRTDINGNVLNKITKYFYNGSYIKFNSIERFAASRIDDPIIIYDNGSKRIIRGYIGFGNLDYITAYNVTNFPSCSYFSDIAISPNFEYLVADFSTNRVHRLNWLGEYVCSFSKATPSFNGFDIPKRISSCAYNFNNHVLLDQYVSSKWNLNSGIRRFLSQSDIFNIEHTIDKNYINLTYYLTSSSKVKLELFKNGRFLWKEEKQYAPSGKNKEKILSSKLKSGTYTLKISCIPRKNNYYGKYKQNWKSKSVSFFIESPLIVTISGPDFLFGKIQPIRTSTGTKLPPPSAIGTWVAHPQGGVGNYSYQWYWHTGLEWAEFASSNQQSLTEQIFGDRNFKCLVTSGTDTASATIHVDFDYLENHPIVNSKTPEETKLVSNYPNPFNPVTEISYQLKEEGEVKITVYDMLGRKVVDLVNTKKPAGFYKVSFNAENLPSGVYIYRMEIGNFVSTKKMILAK